jgi:hypothetical protein
VETDRERCRQLLANMEFVNALAMPPQSRACSWLFRWTSTVVPIAVFPVTVLLLAGAHQFAAAAGPGDERIHHACLAIDLVLLVWFLGRQAGDRDGSFWRATALRKATLCWLPATAERMAGVELVDPRLRMTW